ncbi:MAG: Fe2+-enterobactin ABC transporter substrate-binding protein [Kluyvera sp.]
MNLSTLWRTAALIAGFSVLGLSSAQAAEWPRQITDSHGVHTLEHKPTRIVSTSVTLTGSLLAIDAPVIASGATTPNNRVADAQGFLRQWGDVAKARKLARLYIGEPSAEAVAAQMPDLILISATGGDSALALYDQLSTIAPTLIINYDDKSWQALLTQLGEITGQEAQASARIAEFNKQLAAVKQQIKLPPQPVSALVYTAAAHSANLWTNESAQGQFLEQLGFVLATLPANLQASQSQGKRHDIIQLGGENLATGLNGESLFLFAGDQKDVDAIYANPLLAHLPAVKNRHVYALGTETFRLDYYSATRVLQRLAELFG